MNSERRRRSNSAQLPAAVIEVAMGELRDVMVQYASCADPGESAARKERTRLAEEEGQFEETAEQMVRASLNLSAADSRKQLSPEISSSHERIPAALRLGPLSAPPPLPPKSKKRTTAKRKPGRPPGRPPGVSQARKATVPSPATRTVGRSKKRKFLTSQPSPRRRLNMDPLLGPLNVVQAETGNPHTSVGEGSRAVSQAS